MQSQPLVSNDPIANRVLVYVFSSPVLVPRDVVLGKFATIRGVKESSTAPMYFLTADFADTLPAVEDQMQPNGNPHHFPGDLMRNNNMFVNPQYPEIGWDAIQNMYGGHNEAETIIGISLRICLKLCRICMNLWWSTSMTVLAHQLI
jgi:hypothetical protein